MARPTVAVERREQIIDATMSIIAEHGMTGTTLDRIAEATGMSRGHVRHFVGNRDKLILDTAIEVFANETGEVGSILRGDITQIDEAIDYLFSAEFTASDRENAVILGLVELARTTPEIADVLTTAYASTRRHLTELVSQAKPKSSPEEWSMVGLGILTCSLGTVFLGDFDHDPHNPDRSRGAAEALLRSIG